MIGRTFPSHRFYHFNPDNVPYSLHGPVLFKEIEQNTVVFDEGFTPQIDIVFSYSSRNRGPIFAIQKFLCSTDRRYRNSDRKPQTREMLPNLLGDVRAEPLQIYKPSPACAISNQGGCCAHPKITHHVGIF